MYSMYIFSLGFNNKPQITLLVLYSLKRDFVNLFHRISVGSNTWYFWS